MLIIIIHYIISAEINYIQPSAGYYPYEVLKGAFPAGIDHSKKEEYLDDSSFVSVLGLTKDAFRALPKWKRDAKKKELGLF